MSGINLTDYEFSAEKQELPEGDYVVIDPCYVIGEDPFWGKYCNWMFRGDYDEQEGRAAHFIKTGEHLIYAFGTAFGDGAYPVMNNGKNVGVAGVDAGMLCLCPMKFIKEYNLQTRWGTEVKLERNAVPEYDKGNVFCGNIQVITGDDECGACNEPLDDQGECSYCDYHTCEECGGKDYSCEGVCDSCEELLEDEANR